MCILFLAIDSHPEYPLIVAANRDEYHRRPTGAMAFWPDHPEVLAGRDLQMGGTWLGITRNGRFCAVTNLRSGTSRADAPSSRGELVKQFLTTTQSAERFSELLCSTSDRFNPFNIVFGTPDRLLTFSSQDRASSRLPAGFHSISNGRMNETWPKMSHGVRELTVLVQQESEISPAQLNRIMQSRILHQRTTPSRNAPDSGQDPFTSSIFILGDQYGTRSTSCVLFRSNAIQVSEQRYDPEGAVTGTAEFIVEDCHG